ncbi:DUF6916 family protein [Roseateles saccharophilus]|uniref:DUF6916 domain-containing protein n=1 Tax=Roseateles saccharophilus TaxID=304 RepID=A0A4R3UZB2_ROSSA|nr:hypothetical protein [Roseateles saccharophilus]MDG0835333.1 hypothetical protein [Roseateles saccharophilus]TCU96138.1 hypothetical protein EV671_101416 [Roseateles saccharophilus]
MINKRDFLKGGATAIVASTGTTAAMARVRPSLGSQAGLASWQAHVGQRFEVDGHPVTLQAVRRVPSPQAGEQFSLSFAGPLPPGLGDALHTLALQGGAAQTLYLARTPLGLRADFCHLQS